MEMAGRGAGCRKLDFSFSTGPRRLPLSTDTPGPDTAGITRTVPPTSMLIAAPASQA